MRIRAFEWLWDRGTEHPWVSWVTHAGIALALAYPFGAVAAGTFYFLREVEQAWRDSVLGIEVDVQDHFMDAWAPIFAATAARLFLGW